MLARTLGTEPSAVKHIQEAGRFLGNQFESDAVRKL
jgi:hypothetical protein